MKRDDLERIILNEGRFLNPGGYDSLSDPESGCSFGQRKEKKDEC